MAEKLRPKILALDFDGTLCEYDGWKGPAHFGKPFPDVVAELHKLKRTEGEEWAIVINTTRRTDYALKAHLDKHNIPYDFINKHPWQPPGSGHKIVADVYLDDRALRFNGNATGLAVRIREAATPWTEKKAQEINAVDVDNACVDALDMSFQTRASLGRMVMTIGDSDD